MINTLHPWDPSARLAACPREIKAIFHQLVELLEGSGRVTVVTQGHRFTGVGHERFAVGEAGMRWVELELWTGCDVGHPTVRTMACALPHQGTPRFRYRLRFRNLRDLDADLEQLLGQVCSAAAAP